LNKKTQANHFGQSREGWHWRNCWRSTRQSPFF